MQKANMISRKKGDMCSTRQPDNAASQIKGESAQSLQMLELCKALILCLIVTPIYLLLVPDILLRFP
jgi:hypothetical protein